MRIADGTSSEELLTAEEFYRRFHDQNCELVDGRIVPLPPPGPEHGKRDSRLIGSLGTFLRQKKLGEHYVNTGFILRRAPDRVRLPDQAFVSNERQLESPEPASGYWPVVPDLVVEIVSPDDRSGDVAEKLRDYLECGVRLAWFIYPMNRHVHVYRPDAPLKILGPDGVLDGEDVVPGFSMPLTELWG